MEHHDVERLTSLLSQLEPGKLPLPVFMEMARLTTVPIIEIVPLRYGSESGIEVLMLVREESDPLWAGMLHTPGTVIRAYDEPGSYKGAFDRILKEELGGTLTTEPVLLKTVLRKVQRGTELASIYYVEVTGEPIQGTFYPLEPFPDNVVESQIGFIHEAAKAYTASQD
ncbi:MAG: hypothetical protein WCO52_00900 [bacterium]